MGCWNRVCSKSDESSMIHPCMSYRPSDETFYPRYPRRVDKRCSKTSKSETPSLVVLGGGDGVGVLVCYTLPTTNWWWCWSCWSYLLVCVCAPLFWIRPWNLTSTTLFISRVLKVRIYIESQVLPPFSSKKAGTWPSRFSSFHLASWMKLFVHPFENNIKTV